MAVGILGLTLSSGILGYSSSCVVLPCALQRVHYSVNMAFVGSVFVV